MRTTKRFVALNLAILLLTTLFVPSALAVEAVIHLDEEVNSSGDTTYTFTAPEDGNYRIQFVTHHNNQPGGSTCATLCLWDGSSSDWSYDRAHKMQKGTTYKISIVATEWYFAGTFTLKITQVRKNEEDPQFTFKEIPVAEYYERHDFSEGMAAVCKSGDGWGFIDITGKEVIACEYSHVQDFSGGMAVVYKGGDSWGLINKAGREVVSLKYNRVGPFSEGLAFVVSQDEKVGFIDQTGREVIACEYAYSDNDYNSYQSRDTRCNFSEGLAAVKDAQTGQWGFIDTSGRKVIPCQYSEVKRFSNARAAVRRESDGKWGYIDKTGREVIEATFTVADTFSDAGYAVVTKPVKVLSPVGTGVMLDRTQRCLIDTTGKTIWNDPIETYNNGAGTYYTNGGGIFNDGITKIYKKPYDSYKQGSVSYMTAEGKMNFGDYQSGGSFSEGMAAVQGMWPNDRWGFIDTTGALMVPMEYRTVKSFSQGLAAVEGNSWKWGYVSKTGEEVVACSYDEAGSFSDGAAWVKKNDKYLLLSINGDKVPSTISVTERFADVRSDAWYRDAIQYVSDKGMMTGVDSDTFSPETTCTRGTVVTMLYRLDGEPAVAGSRFSDVPQGAWYAKGAAWAAANGIVNGFEDATFRPESPVTREQLAAILYRYAAKKGYDVTSRAGLTGFSDAGNISTYAVDAMGWAKAAGIITGTDWGGVDPTGTAIRAEIAAMLMRFCENVMK